jgi:hypothetical protein
MATLEKRVDVLEARGGGGPRCPECGDPHRDDGDGRLPLIVLRKALSGELISASLGGVEISEKELREIEANRCPVCTGPQITLPGGQWQR